MTATEPILHLPANVVEDVQGYREHVKEFLEGETSPMSFKAYRVPMGIYEQRATGKYMVRVRLGAGLVLPHQLARIAHLSKRHGSGTVHVTTRQDMQIHEVDIENTPAVLEGLLQVGLAARGGGGNTVRNVSACPRSGVCRREVFNVAPYAIATAEYLLQHASSFNLPRKFKIAFSGCAADCGLASVADLGFFAHKANGTDGFAVYAGGGLGPNSRVGVKIEDCVGVGEVLEVTEAVKRLFDKHGDRSNKHRARLRYVLGRLGTDEFVGLYRQQRDAVAKDGLAGDIPEIRQIGSRSAKASPSGDDDDSAQPAPAGGMPEKTADSYTIGIRLALGDVSSEDLLKIAEIAEESADGFVRTTQLQNLLICGVPGRNVGKVREQLDKLGIDVAGKSRPKVVACTGAATCKLGLCLSRGLAGALAKEFETRNITAECGKLVIRISGCPNSCGHHHIADVGFEGKAKRVGGRLVPFYDVLIGANIGEGNSHLAARIGSLPAKRIPQVVAEASVDGKIDKKRLTELVSRYGDVSSEMPEEYYHDFGSDEPFSLAGRGPGECGVGVMDIIRVDINEAKDCLKRVAACPAGVDRNEAIYGAIVGAARALLYVFGLEPRKDREVFDAFGKHLIEPGWVKAETSGLIDTAIDFRLGDKNTIAEAGGQAKELVERVEKLFLSLDASLKFRIEPIEERQVADEPQAKRHRADLRGVACPMNFVKAKLALERIRPGEVLEVLLDDGEPVKNVSASFQEQGQELLAVDKVGSSFSIKVKRKQ